MIFRTLPTLAALLLCAGSAHAQIAASLDIAKKQHLAGEPVIAVVTITNHSGRDLVFQSDGRFQWMDFIVKKSNGNPVNGKNRTLFGPMKIQAGQTLAREVDLSQHFQLGEPGNFSVSAVIQHARRCQLGQFHQPRLLQPESGTALLVPESRTSPELPAIPASSACSISPVTTKSQIYAQIVDGMTGQFVRTFLLGDVLMLRKPLATVDRQQRMHVMFLATPTMWVHCVIDTDGRLVDRQIHQRGPQGDPQLLTFADGTVSVANSIPYDPKAAAEERAKIRKASDRPPIPY